MSFLFPPEIEDEIFRWTVRMRPYHRADASLPCVSKRVQACVEPILYETVKLRGNNRAISAWTVHDKVFAVALDSRPPSFFEMHVKNLCLSGSMSKDRVARVLSICTGVRNLAFWGRSGRFDISPVMKLRLHSLDTSVVIIRDLSKLHQTLPELVYLSASCGTDKEVMPSLEWLPALARVHLLVGRYDDMVPATMGIIRVVLQTCGSLQLLLIQVDYADDWDFDRAEVEPWREEDRRITINYTSPEYNKRYDWEERVACNT